MSGISQYTGGKPPRKSHPLDPLLQPCDTALRLPIPMPRSPPGRGRTARKPSAAGAFLHDHQPSGVRGERKVAGESSGSSYPFKGRLAEGSLFSSHIPEIGARQGDPLLHQVGSEPAGSPSSPPPQTRAQMHAHTHSPGSHHPEPLHGPRKSPPARAPKRSPPGAPGSARWGSEAPALTLGLPTATAIATAARVAPDCSPPTQAAAAAAAGAPVPAGLPRASLAAAPCSRPAPARLQPHLLARAAPPALFQQHGLPPGRDHWLPRDGGARSAPAPAKRSNAVGRPSARSAGRMRLSRISHRPSCDFLPCH